ncbi:chitin-binding domain-containing protein [Acinetobacter pittii]|uniref:chitin-binding domain-containing protein n=1 Tax=Acinetobacter pittii TaxID=48296 RepID=UPI0034D22EBC
MVAPAPAVAVAAPVTKTQYHAQDELGNAAFGHSEPGQVHTSVQDGLGNRVGSYSYFNPTDGKVHRTDYVADSLGFRVAANDLPIADLKAPEPVTDTPEVVAAKEARASGADLPKADLPAPEPVTDTPEVVAARAAHLSEHRAKRSVLLQTPAATAPLATPLIAAPLAHSVVAHPIAAHSIVAHHPVAVHHPIAYSAIPAGIPATLTTIVNNPGHAVSYRID